jgi:hypothetical protein
VPRHQAASRVVLQDLQGAVLLRCKHGE